MKQTKASILIVMLIASLIAGTGWILIPYQFQQLSVEISLAIRFFLSGLFILGYIFVRNRNFRLNLSYKTHLIAATQGAIMYSVAYLLLYQAVHYLPTGIISIIVSMVILPTTLFEVLIFRTKISKKFMLGIALSAIGIYLLYFESIDFEHKNPKDALYGILFILTGISCTGLSTNITKLLKENLPISNLEITALGMLYGAVICFIYALLIGKTLIIPTLPIYYLSLLYLVVIVGPGVLLAYMWLIDKAGPSKASLIWILAPIVAINLSVLYEGVEWNRFTFGGTALVLIGSWLCLQQKKST